MASLLPLNVRQDSVPRILSSGPHFRVTWGAKSHCFFAVPNGRSWPIASVRGAAANSRFRGQSDIESVLRRGARMRAGPTHTAAFRANDCIERWADDERADEIWNTIKDTAQKRGMLLPARFFIQEVLGTRDIVTSMNHRRKYRERYRKHATRMAEIAKILRERLRVCSAASIPYNFRTQTDLTSRQPKMPDLTGGP